MHVCERLRHRTSGTAGRALAALLVASALAGPARAHFIWIHVLRDEQPARAEFLFGDGIYQDSDANLVRYVEGLEAWTAGGPPLELEVHGWGLDAVLPPATGLVGATRPMGVFTPPRGGENRLLRYYAKGAADLGAAGKSLGMRAEVLASAQGAELVLQVLFDSQPAAAAEVQVTVPGSADRETLIADGDGRVRVPRPISGAFQARGRVIVPQPGEEDGESYTTVQHYATLVIASMREGELAAGVELDAYQRLERATSCQERLPGSLGLGGVLKVNVDGALWRGEFDYRDGALALRFEGAPEDLSARLEGHVERLLRRLAASAGGSEDGQGRLTLAPREGHPLGRRIDLDGGSSGCYRVLEDEVRLVERRTGATRTTLIVDESLRTATGRFLPAHTTRTTLDAETGALLRVEVYADEYQEVEGLMLPASRRVTVLADDAVSTVAIEFRNLELLTEANRQGVRGDSPPSRDL